MAGSTPAEERDEQKDKTRSWVIAVAGGIAYLLLGVLVALLLDRYINPADSAQTKDLVLRH